MLHLRRLSLENRLQAFPRTRCPAPCDLEGSWRGRLLPRSAGLASSCSSLVSFTLVSGGVPNNVLPPAAAQGGEAPQAFQVNEAKIDSC